MSEESEELQPVLVDQESISSLIYEVRGVKVMLNADFGTELWVRDQAVQSSGETQHRKV